MRGPDLLAPGVSNRTPKNSATIRRGTATAATVTVIHILAPIKTLSQRRTDFLKNSVQETSGSNGCRLAAQRGHRPPRSTPDRIYRVAAKENQSWLRNALVQHDSLVRVSFI